ncbi:hypothetical protein, partial [Mycobacterium paraffinicum]|uniref:hypothetical protein n=1 Tax=Mycobacterium paraffinicum TaxID=53378 RepID=UPI0031F0C76F
MKTNSGYARALYTLMAVLFLAPFVLNVCTHGTTLGLISTGGLTVLMAYLAYRAWFGKRRINRLFANQSALMSWWSAPLC